MRAVFDFCVVTCLGLLRVGQIGMGLGRCWGVGIAREGVRW